MSDIARDCLKARDLDRYGQVIEHEADNGAEEARGRQAANALREQPDNDKQAKVQIGYLKRFAEQKEDRRSAGKAAIPKSAAIDNADGRSRTVAGGESNEHVADQQRAVDEDL